LYRYKVIVFRIRFIFLKIVFIKEFFKMAPIRVRFSPGFPPGAGFSGEECAPVWL
jgi:hypothetical protein